ncbi:MAG: thiol protease/hemagglutinin PrtT [Muribaculaceae bacterium]|nr:thiol protease/hemagglutinin PrtT [Muribaculaceae bacterium]
MKKTLALLTWLLAPMALCAESISPTQAASIASGFMHGIRPAATRLKAHTAKSQTPGLQQPYYIFNAGNGDGYVIVSGDDRLGTILGYSDKGYIDLSEAPDGLIALLQMYETAYSAATSGATMDEAAPLATTPSVIVQPLLGDITWGQDTPFNTLTPTYTSSGKLTNYYTGCVACAATQIMRKYSYPERGTGSKTYTDPASGQTLSADFGSTTYDWDNMPAIVPDAPSADQTLAYSTLAAQMGVAIEMQYEAAGSGTYDMLVPYALRTYFGYDAAIRSHHRTYYSTSEWMDIIKTELDEGRPVFYGGTSDTGSGGHAFVLDGYDSADYVHVNWGWYGSSNGYFMINHLDPSSLGAGGGSGGYNVGQDMITGIRPAQPGSKRDYSIYGATRMSIDGPYGDTFVVMTYIENTDVEPFTGRMEALLIDADGNVVANLGGENITVGGFAGGYSGQLLFNPKNVSCTVSNIPDGKYRMCLGYKADGDDGWTILRHPKGLPGYADVSVSHGYISITSKHVPAPDGVIKTAIATDGDLYAGGTAMVRFTAENRSTDYVISNITLRLTAVTDPAATYDATVNASIYDQSTENLELYMPVDAAVPAGEYYMTALVKTADNEYPFDDTEAGRTIVTVLPGTSGPVVRAASDMIWSTGATGVTDGAIIQGDILNIAVSLRNAASPGTAKVFAKLVNVATGESLPFKQTDIAFDDSRARSTTFSRYLPCDPGTYRVELCQLDDNYAETSIAPYASHMEITVEPSANIVAEMVSISIPDHLTQGEKTACSITYRGLRTTSQTLYLRIRRLTNSGGEIMYMGRQSFEAGVEKDLNFSYKPSSTLDDGLYMILAETGTSSNPTVLGNASAYGKIISMGNVSAIESVEASRPELTIWIEGTTLHVGAEGAFTVTSVSIFNLTGATVLRNSLDLSSLSAGLYIADVTLTDGRRATAKIALR